MDATILSFRHWLKHVRVEQDLTQEALAERVGCSLETIRAFEAGRRRPSRAMAERIVAVLDVPPEERSAILQAARVQPERAPVLEAEEEALPPLRLAPLPIPSTALVGRSAELAAICRQLTEASCRFLTILGPGGVGKTRLAMQVATRVRDHFADGVAFVALAPISAAEQVATTIAEAVGCILTATDSSAETLIGFLRDRRMLVVLDNLEHLPDAAPLLSLLLREVPGVQFLGTSRERLRLHEEWAFPLGGLALPVQETQAAVEQSAAVQLFVERARQIVEMFALSDTNRSAVARICHLVDGLPLGIELAAAWSHALTPAEIVAELQHGLDFLVLSNRDVDPRHRTIRAVLDHSWSLLNAAERHALARLSVFHGGCEREAATIITGVPLPTIVALLDKSLVQPRQGAATTRFTLHELVLRYAAERLAETPADQQATEERHSAYYAELLQRSLGTQSGEVYPKTWAVLARDIDNLRAAWIYAAKTGATTIVLNMAHGLMTLYDYHGWLLDGATLFGQAADALQAAGKDADSAYGFVLGIQGYLLFRSGQLTASVPLLNTGVAIAEAAGNSRVAAQLLMYSGTVELSHGHFSVAQQQYLQSAELAARANNQATYLWALFFQGMIALYTNDLTTAEQHFTTCLKAWRTQNYGRGIASSLNGLADIALERGDIAAAERAAREGLQITSLSHDAPALGRSLRQLGMIALERGELDEARYLLTESCESLWNVGDLGAYSRSRYFLVRLDIRSGNYEAAWQGCRALLHRVSSGDATRLTESAYCIALLLHTQDNDQEAFAVLTALESVPGQHTTLHLIAELRADLKRRLAPAQQAAAIAHASKRPPLPLLEELCDRSISSVTSATSAATIREASAIPPAKGLLVADSGETLSPREIEVLRLLMGGASNQAIAGTLHISLHTAKHHVANILQKLGATTRTQAAIRGRALGLEPDQRAIGGDGEGR